MYSIIKTNKMIEGIAFTSYGIVCCDGNSKIALYDISLNENDIEELLKELKQYEISPIHFRDYVEDFMAE